MAKPALDALDWDTAPVFDGLEAQTADQFVRAERPRPAHAVQAEKPPAAAPKPTDQKILIREAVKILDVTRTQVDHWVKAGVLTKHGKSEKGLIQLSLEEVQALAAERASRKLERKLPGPEREQAQMERAQISVTGFQRSESSRREQERHTQLLEALRELRIEQEDAAHQQLLATRELVREQRETNEQLSTLNTALLVASLGAAGAALLPDHFIQEIKAKVGGAVGRVFRPEGQPVQSLLSEDGGGARQLTAGETRMIIEELARKVEEGKNSKK